MVKIGKGGYVPPVAELTCFVPKERISVDDTVMTQENAATFFSNGVSPQSKISFTVTDPDVDLS